MTAGRQILQPSSEEREKSSERKEIGTKRKPEKPPQGMPEGISRGKTLGYDEKKKKEETGKITTIPKKSGRLRENGSVLAFIELNKDRRPKCWNSKLNGEERGTNARVIKLEAAEGKKTLKTIINEK